LREPGGGTDERLREPGDGTDERLREEAKALMRIGMVCPYSFDVPGGVQSHVLQLA
jgi:hypothetical protein